MTHAFALRLTPPASFVGMASLAQHRAVEEEEFLLPKTRLLERVRTRANPRKEAALLQMFVKGPDALKGYLYVAKYRTAIDAPSAIAKPSLPFLVQIGTLQKQVALKRTRYFLGSTANGSRRVEQGTSPAR